MSKHAERSRAQSSAEKNRNQASKNQPSGKGKTRTVNVWFPEEVILLIDRAVANTGQTRGQFIEEAIREQWTRLEAVLKETTFPKKTQVEAESGKLPVWLPVELVLGADKAAEFNGISREEFIINSLQAFVDSAHEDMTAASRPSKPVESEAAPAEPKAVELCQVWRLSYTVNTVCGVLSLVTNELVRRMEENEEPGDVSAVPGIQNMALHARLDLANHYDAAREEFKRLKELAKGGAR